MVISLCAIANRGTYRAFGDVKTDRSLKPGPATRASNVSTSPRLGTVEEDISYYTRWDLVGNLRMPDLLTTRSGGTSRCRLSEGEENLGDIYDIMSESTLEAPRLMTLTVLATNMRVIGGDREIVG